ncbi:MAG: mechanosensitive ion channel family protein [Candidatus Diapherotrites archaeon]
MELAKLRKPLMVTVTVAAVAVFLYYYGKLLLTLTYEQFLNEQAVAALMPQFLSFAALIIGTEIFLIISRFALARYLEAHYGKREVKLLLGIYTYVAWGFVAIIIIAGFFKDVGALLTSLGLIGFGLTLALQKPILNLVGWLTIFLTDPFTVGERIEVSSVRGDVLAVKTMYTRLQGTRVNSQQKTETIITIPNEFILTNAVINYSRMNDQYTDDITFSITYESNWKKASEIIERAALDVTLKYIQDAPKTRAEKLAWQQALRLLREAPKKIRKGFTRETDEGVETVKAADGTALPEIPKPNVLVTLGASSIDLNVTYKTYLRAIRATKNEVTRRVVDEFDKAKDIEFAYPHMEIVAGDKSKSRKGAGKSILAYSE